MVDEKIVSLDIETSGLSPHMHSVLEIAIQVFSLDRDVLNVDKFHCFVKNNVVHWDDDTFDFHKKNGYFEYVQEVKAANASNPAVGHAKYGIVPTYRADECRAQIAGFLEDCGVYKPPLIGNQQYLEANKNYKSKSCTALGKNVARFDIPFLNNMAQGFEHKKVFKHHVLDLGNLWWHPVIDGATLPEFKVCVERAGFKDHPDFVGHRAMDDANMNRLLLLKYVELFR